MSEKNNLIKIVSYTSEQWKAYFNSGNADGCASCYEENAVIVSKTLGNFTGREEIKNFWSKIISDGFSDVKYIDPIIYIIDDEHVILTSKWKMNKAQGVIFKELWIVTSDGKALLREDHFEIVSL